MKLSKNSALKIVKEISELINQHVNIMDKEGYIVASTDTERIGAFHEGAKIVVEQELERLIIEYDGAYIGAKKGINLPIVVDEECIGVIGITGDLKQVEVYAQIIKRMTQILVIEAYKNAEELAIETIRSKFIKEWLLDKSKMGYKFLRDRGKNIAIDITLPRRVMVMQFNHRLDELEENQIWWEQIEQYIKKNVERDDCINLFIEHNAKMIAIVRSRSDVQMLDLAKAIKQCVEESYGIHILIGIDDKQEGYEWIHEAYTLAKKALDVTIMRANESITLYREIKLELFIQDTAEQVKEEFVRKVLGDKMTEQDIGEMIVLTEALLVCDGSINEASKKLYMHKNTLQYKLNRIYEKTGYNPRSLKDIPILYMLILALKSKGDYKEMINCKNL